MKRAAVFIGVDKTGDLPTLNDAAKGASRMADWALRQGVDKVVVLTDEDGDPVIARDIKKAIKAIVEPGNIEQLLIYFAGHGVNLGYSEYWLLSEAPDDTQEAVNVRGSEILARYCGIPHVVFISDACRTAAQGIQAQGVTGSEIFPNQGAGDVSQAVDQFFACTLGNPAAEVRDPNTTTDEYSALYTEVLGKALSGMSPEVLEWAADGSVAFVRPHPLKVHLESEVQRRIVGLDLQTKLIQRPDAIVVSRDAWISRLTSADIPHAAAAPSRGATRGASPPPRAQPAPAPESTASVSEALVRSALSGDASTVLGDYDRDARGLDDDYASDLLMSAERTAEPFGPMHHETECGFKIRGARFVEAQSRAAVTELFERPGQVVRVNGMDMPGASVLLVLEEGTGALLPAVPGFLAALTVEDGALVDVAYEPSDNTGRWQAFEQRAPEIRALRAIVSSSMSRGVFRLDGDDALATARRMQYAKSVDPTLAIYAAYAYNDFHQRDLIRQMRGYLRSDIGAAFFDIAMLAGDLDEKDIFPDGAIYSSVPLLAQGWALLSAFRVRLPPSLAALQRRLVPSMWTLLDPDGVEEVRDSFQTGEL